MTPYSRVNARGFWRPAVAERHMLDITDLWQPKFPIGREDRISTYGSCFAQHIGAALRGSGFRWFEAEEPPFGLSPENRKRFNYGVFTARTGNIYTTTMLLQWVDWALGHAPVPDEIWEDGGRFQDPFRPAIEPEGFDSVAELRACRQATLAAFRRSITQADVFVFTLGLTERWINARQGHEYAVCPGTAETDMNEREWALEGALTGADRDTVRARYLADIPAGRFLTPDDVGEVVAWLATGATDFITGQSICVNGATVLH